MTAQPQTISNDLINRLNVIRVSGRRPNDIEVMRLKRDAESLKKLSPVDAYIILGGLECLLGNLEECQKYHDISLQHEFSVNTLNNYASSMVTLGESKKTLELLERANNLSTGDLSTLDRYLSTAWDYCQFRLSAKLLQEWKKLSPRKEHVLANETQLEELCRAATTLDISECKMLEICECINKFLCSNKIPHKAFTNRVYWDRNAPIITKILFVDTKDDDQISKLNLDLTSYLVEHLENLASEKFVVLFDMEITEK